MERSDALAPVVTITSPRSGTVRTAENLQVSGYALDDEGVRAVRVNGLDLLGASFYEEQRGKKLVRFAFIPQSVGEGRWESTIEVEDVDGRVSTLDFPLEIDTTPPTLEITGIEGLAEGARARRGRGEGQRSSRARQRKRHGPLVHPGGAGLLFARCSARRAGNRCRGPGGQPDRRTAPMTHPSACALKM